MFSWPSSSDTDPTDTEPELSSTETEIQEEKQVEEEEKQVEEEEKQGEEEEKQGEEEKEEDLKCTVCYEKLTIKNIVNTQCKHLYCWECFFKWIKTNPTCPYCRCNFMSEDAWYENRDVEDDINNLRSMANILQLELVKASTRLNCIDRRKRVLKRKVNKLRRDRELNLKSLISTSEQIEYMRGYHSALRGDKKDSNFTIRNNVSQWFRGFTMGVYEIQQERYNIDYKKFNCFTKSILNENEIKKFKKIIKLNKLNYVPAPENEGDNQLSLGEVIQSRVRVMREREQNGGETKQESTAIEV